MKHSIFTRALQRWPVFLVASVLTVSALTGCGGNDSASTTTSTTESASTKGAVRAQTAAATSTDGLLAGSADLGGQIDTNATGNAEAFITTAQSSGTASELRVYLDASNTASRVVVGVYADGANDSPGSLLASGSIDAPQAGAWNSISLSSLSVTSGQRYWIALLAPTGATGEIKFRDVASGGTAWTSSETNLSTLPSTWSNGARWASSPLSAYLYGTSSTASAGNNPPAVSFTSPASGSSFTAPANIVLTASASDDGSVTKVEFFSGATKLGEALAAPYSMTWANVAAGSYAIQAVATDNEGISASASITVNVASASPTVVLGYSGEGNTTDTLTDSSGAYINANRFQAQSSRTVATIRAKVGAISGKYQTAIYADANGSPGALLAASQEVTPSSAGWTNFPLKTTLAMTSGTSYWLAIWSNDSAARVYANNGGDTLHWGKYAYSSTWPANLTLDGTSSFLYAIYATDDTSEPAPAASTAGNLIVSGGTRYQSIVGMGVNAHSNAWEGGALKPALDILIDSAGVSMWRVVVESHRDWETTNDDNDPKNFNWSYYNTLFETAKFQSLWSVLGYLKERNAPIIMLNVMGNVPVWMGETQVNPSMEDEWVEMITSLLVYARQTKGLRIDLLSPLNEIDIGRQEGPLMDQNQYVRVMNKLRTRMDELGLGDIPFYGPDTASVGDGTDKYMPAMMADATLMQRVSGFAFHNYDTSQNGAYDKIRNSAYPDRPFIMTEFSKWCDGCDNGAPQPADYEFARGTGVSLMSHLSGGAAGTLLWEGYDCYYEHHGAMSYWGALGRENGITGSYFARKRMHVVAQFTRYIRPGAVRVAISSQVSGVSALAFTGGGSPAVVVGQNNQTSSAELTLRFDDVSGIKNARLIQTTPTKDQETSALLPVTNGVLTVRVDGDSFFTVVTSQ
jgi:hypothetical protein